ncbi:hypothetical protein [Paenibacillus riograndensis]|uniref:hypothetical protein n=1 Tax=Paenibacillus riograndensis TaxID=483937 RepID=UPI002F914A45
MLIEAFTFKADKLLPNNPGLPAVLYKRALQENPESAEQLFNDNGWRNSWVNGVFSYHHYHSNAHEVLGVMSGSASLQLGGMPGAGLRSRPGMSWCCLPVRHISGSRPRRTSASPALIPAEQTTTPAGPHRKTSQRRSLKSARCRCRIVIRSTVRRVRC